MIIKNYKRDGWEIVDLVVKSALTYSVTAGFPLSFDIITAQDGSVTIPATSNLNVFAGIAIDTFGTSGEYNDVGKVRAYGWVDKIFVAGTTITVGAKLVPVNAASYLTLAVSHSTSAIETPNEWGAMAIAGEAGCAIATSTFSTVYYIKGFVRALK